MNGQLSNDAFELLTEAGGAAQGIISKVRTFGGLDITTNGRCFSEMGNARSEARWEAALNELILYGLVKDRGFKGEVFAVTHLGYQVIDQGIPTEEQSPTVQPEAMGFRHIVGKD